MLRLRLAAALSLAATCAAALGVQSATAPPATADSVRDGQQGVLAMLNVPAAWTVSRGQGVTVALLDSGVQPAVSDLAGSVTAGPDLTGLSTSPSSAGWGRTAPGWRRSSPGTATAQAGRTASSASPRRPGSCPSG